MAGPSLRFRTHLNADSLRLSPYYSGFFIWGLGTGAQQLARPLFAYEFGASVFLIVLVTASNALASLVSAPLTGLLTDRLGRKPLVLLGNGIRGVTTLLQFFSGSYWEFFILEFIGAFGVAMWTTCGAPIIDLNLKWRHVQPDRRSDRSAPPALHRPT